MRPVEHGFSYRLFMMYLDLDELDTVFSTAAGCGQRRRRAPARFRREDHLGDPAVPLDRLCARTGGRRRSRRGHAGPIRLLTHLQYFGYCFNPVSFYYCFDARRFSGSRPLLPKSITRPGASATAMC